MSMAEWTLGGVITVALAIGVFAWYTSKTNYERDKEIVLREAKASATELRAEYSTQFDAEAKRLENSLDLRSASIAAAVNNLLAPDVSAIRSLVRRLEDDVLDLKEDAIEREATLAFQAKKYRLALRKFCELFAIYKQTDMLELKGGNLIDKIREIVRNPEANLDADAVTNVISVLRTLPANFQTACDPLIVQLQRKLE